MKHAFAAAAVVAFTSYANASTVAITEFMSNPLSLGENTGEWIELFNYGADPVNLNGFWLGDADIDSTPLPDITLLSGQYMIFAIDADAFVGEWGVGEVGIDVFDYDNTAFASLALSNGADELILTDAEDNVVWNLAYTNDESDGESTYLTMEDFSVTDFGSKDETGVVRQGDDLGLSGFLGYEEQAGRTESASFSSLGGDTGSPLAGNYSVVPTPGTAGVIGVAAFVAGRRRR